MNIIFGLKKFFARCSDSVRDIFKNKEPHAVSKMLRSVRFWLVMLLPLSVILRFLFGSFRQLADFYCDNIYRYVSVAFNFLSGLVPFSVAEIILLCVIPLFLIYVIWVTVKIVKRKGKRPKTFLNAVLNVVCLVSVVFFLFNTNCGFNYMRSDFESLSGLETAPVSVDRLYDTCVYLAENAAVCGKNVKRDGNNVMKLSGNTRAAAAEAVNSLHSKYDFIYDGYGMPKNVMLSRGMSFLEITGVYFPFTFEANVNNDVPDYSVPSTMCHELSHVRGFMREEEANFVSFLACIMSENDDFKYSGYMMALTYAGNALYSADKEKYSELVRNFYTEEMNADIRASAEYWEQFETPAAEAATKINDRYLKSNSQNDGVKSYGKMTDLVIAYLTSENI